MERILEPYAIYSRSIMKKKKDSPDVITQNDRNMKSYCFFSELMTQNAVSSG